MTANDPLLTPAISKVLRLVWSLKLPFTIININNYMVKWLTVPLDELPRLARQVIVERVPLDGSGPPEVLAVA
jgi:hypothetical protein